MRCKVKQSGVSLAEILIVLALCGVLSAFLIPKFLVTQSQTSLTNKYNASARNVAFMLVTAFERYKANNPTMKGSSGNGVSASDIAPYFNYVAVSSTMQLDDLEGFNDLSCNSDDLCFKLHNGGLLHHWNDHFCNSGSDPTAIIFEFDPDAVYSGTTSGISKSIRFYLYSDGTIRTGANMKANTQWTSYDGTPDCWYSRSFDPDPTWFTSL